MMWPEPQEQESEEEAVERQVVTGAGLVLSGVQGPNHLGSPVPLGHDPPPFPWEPQRLTIIINRHIAVLEISQVWARKMVQVMTCFHHMWPALV